MSLSHKQVVERFKNGRSGSGGNIISNGNVLYSYGAHFPMKAKVVVKGQEITLGTYRTYSVTTAKHLRRCSVLSSDFLVYEPTDNSEQAIAEIQKAIPYYEIQIKELNQKHNRARCEYRKDFYYEKARYFARMKERATNLLNGQPID